MVVRSSGLEMDLILKFVFSVADVEQDVTFHRIPFIGGHKAYGKTETLE